MSKLPPSEIFVEGELKNRSGVKVEGFKRSDFDKTLSWHLWEPYLQSLSEKRQEEPETSILNHRHSAGSGSAIE